MPPEILALLDKPLSLVAVLFVGALIGMTLEQVISRQRREAWKKRNAHRWQKKGGGNVTPLQAKLNAATAATPKVPDAADQLRTVMRADFTVQPLLNKSEARLFKALDRFVLEHRPDWQVMAQVSLGEILRSADSDAYRCINSKRVDLLIVDEQCRPLHAIEYQGGGHFKGAHATAARDAVKKEALRRAGIGYVEVVGGEMTAAELRPLVEKLVKAEIAA